MRPASASRTTWISWATAPMRLKLQSDLLCAVSNLIEQRHGEALRIGEILIALREAPLVARLVLGADQATRRSTAQGRWVDIGAGAADLVLDMSADPLGRSERPALAGTIGERSGKPSSISDTARDMGVKKVMNGCSITGPHRSVTTREF